jgi:hypothetical protein
MPVNHWQFVQETMTARNTHEVIKLSGVNGMEALWAKVQYIVNREPKVAVTKNQKVCLS